MSGIERVATGGNIIDDFALLRDFIAAEKLAEVRFEDGVYWLDTQNDSTEVPWTEERAPTLIEAIRAVRSADV